MDSDALEETTNRLRMLLRQKVPDLLLQAECGGGLELPTPLPWGFASVPTLYELADVAERELNDLKAQQERSSRRRRISRQHPSGGDRSRCTADEPHPRARPGPSSDEPGTSHQEWCEGQDEEQQQQQKQTQRQEQRCSSLELAAQHADEQGVGDQRRWPQASEDNFAASRREGLAASQHQRQLGSADLVKDPGGNCGDPGPKSGHLGRIVWEVGQESGQHAVAAADEAPDSRTARVDNWRLGDDDSISAAALTPGMAAVTTDPQQAWGDEAGPAQAGRVEGPVEGTRTSRDPGFLLIGVGATAEQAAAGEAEEQEAEREAELSPELSAELSAELSPQRQQPYACKAFLESLQQSRTFRSPHCEAAMVEAMGMAELYDGLVASTLGPPPGRHELEALRGLLKDHINARWALESVKQGVAVAKQGNYADAHKAYTRALELDPTSAEAYVARGAAHANQRFFAEAERDLRRALELDPGHRNAATYLDAVLRHVEERRQELQALEEERQQTLTRQHQKQPREPGRRSLAEVAVGEKGGIGAGAAGRGGRWAGDSPEERHGPQGPASAPGRLAREEHGRPAAHGGGFHREEAEGRQRRVSDSISVSSESSSGSGDSSDGIPGQGRGPPLQPGSDDIRRALAVVLKARKQKKSKHKRPKKKHKKFKRRRRE